MRNPGRDFSFKDLYHIAETDILPEDVAIF
jgi:hypothetical protein